MKKHSFLAGMLTMALIVGLGMSALAATGQVSFNASALTLNGTQVSAKGENYTLANGQSVPASITYTDEKGGGTTYLPVRRISELLGVETGWDGAAGAVTVKGEVKAPTTPETSKTDYSTWTAEEEKAYQEFKGLWEVGNSTNSGSVFSCDLIIKSDMSNALMRVLQSNSAEKIDVYSARHFSELNTFNYSVGWITYYTQSKVLLWGVTSSTGILLDGNGPQSSYSEDCDRIMKTIGM